MKNIFFALALTSAMFSCQKETTTPNTNGNTNTTDTTKNSTIGKSGPNITDIDGNTYKTVTIGTQTWMAENLKVSKYNDGTVIPNIIDNTQWSNLDTGAWANYNNDASNNAKYGKLYNGYAVSLTMNGNKNICPTGWHLPNDDEWTILTDYLGGESIAGGKMKEVGIASWYTPNTDGTNSSLFTALPGGYRNFNGNYNYVGNSGYWWAGEMEGNSYSWFRNLNYYNGVVKRSNYYNNYGFSVRCVMD
jgi:uncharacterized protein (TIGR02145 family)